MAPLLIATTGLQAMGSIMQGNAAADAGAAQQAAYNQAAENERLAAGYEATRVYDRGRRAQSAALVQVAGSGVSLAGSPTEVLADNAIQTQMDVDAIRFGSQIKQQNLRTQGDLAFMQGQQKQQAGYLGAITNVAGGLTQLYTPRSSVRLGGSAFA
ncbi:hypothetical protein [Bradyrhizobium japonicum]|uniref:hypothetical protein n=1 Tax=Bradyrhizobium japonicum TaxID=375 RepID=UPI0003FC844D|nr:hypothetical protein [Bradyrhizobium japonicum]